MIKEEHKLDTIAWLIITVICASALAIYMVSDNLSLKRENYGLLNNIKKCEQRVDSLEAACDTLRHQNEMIEDYCLETIKNYENEISFLGHSLDKHNIRPDYSNLGR
jgi:hypothetical protein